MRDMTTGSPVRQILAFSIPLLIGNLFQQFYSLADSIIVGRMLGTAAFAAVGSTGSLNFLVLGLALGSCSGFSIPIAQSFGAGDHKAVRRRCGQCVWLCLLPAIERSGCMNIVVWKSPKALRGILRKLFRIKA